MQAMRSIDLLIIQEAIPFVRRGECSTPRIVTANSKIAFDTREIFMEVGRMKTQFRIVWAGRESELKRRRGEMPASNNRKAKTIYDAPFEWATSLAEQINTKAYALWKR